MKRLYVALGAFLLLGGCGEEGSSASHSGSQVKGEQDRAGAERLPVPVQLDTGNHYVNGNGKIAISGPFDSAAPFSNGLAQVSKGGDTYFINKKGDEVFTSKYEAVEPFSNGYALISANAGKDETMPRYGYIDKKGNLQIHPVYFTASSFSEGLALGVYPNDAEEEWEVHLIDTNGDMKKLPNLSAGNTTTVLPFSEGRAVILPSQYAHAYLIDKEGKILSQDTYQVIQSFHNGLAPAMILDEATGEEHWGYIDKQGEKAIPFQYDDALEFGNQASLAQSGGSWGIINKKGEWIKEPAFESASTFSDGLAAVKIDGRWGYANEAGEMVISPQFTSAEPFRGGLAEVTVGQNTGYINSKGKYVIKLSDLPSEKTKEQEPISKEEAATRLYQEFRLAESKYKVYFEGMTEKGNYRFWVHEFVIDDSKTGEGHTATYGFFDFNPYTGEYQNIMDREEESAVERGDTDSRVVTSEGGTQFDAGYFSIDCPEHFQAEPSYPYENDEGSGFEMVTFVAEHSPVSFFAFAGSAEKDPEEIALNPSLETLSDVKNEKTEKAHVQWYRIDANDQSYTRVYERTVYPDGSQVIVGLKFDSWDTYEEYKDQYLEFKKSFKKNN
ncbi:WG repeat-containing protein [Pseudobacillus sp. 179-B 2D1 NHS]|uniref:WG repeat-containing protein n=1 Tax=Pseudobacillus sp. 179-B 2D1 NHS TaxID=3374292 RepID=UPI003879E2A9